MKRFYKDVAIAPGQGGQAIRLDGRAVRTPARAELVLPSAALADAVAAEWREQGDRIEPRSMPMTGLANAAIDHVAPDPSRFTATLATYAETDLLCYRAESPPTLVAREAAEWDPLLAWARGRYDVAFEIATGIVHRPQPPATLARLEAAVAALDPFRLAALSPLVTITGSLVLALALVEDAITPDAAWTAAQVDEDWQAERWGEDPLAAAARANRRREFDAGVRFLAATGDTRSP